MEKDEELIRKILQKSEGLPVDLSAYSDDQIIYHYYLLFENNGSHQATENTENKKLSPKNPGR